MTSSARAEPWPMRSSIRSLQIFLENIMPEQVYNPATLISTSASTRTGSGKTLPMDPVCTVVGVVILGIVIPLAVAAYMGRGSIKGLRMDQERLRRQRASVNAHLRAKAGKAPLV